jgi:hypothetical protein
MLEFGANLFFWIVAFLIGLITAISLLDARKIHGPQQPHSQPEDMTGYWESRKHAEQVHQEFPGSPAKTSVDPITGRP